MFQLFFGLHAAITSSSVGGGRHLKSTPNLWNQLMLAAHCCQGNVYGMMALKIKFHTLPPPANGRRGHKYDAAFTGSDRVVRTPAKDASESFAKILVRVYVCLPTLFASFCVKYAPQNQEPNCTHGCVVAPVCADDKWPSY